MQAIVGESDLSRLVAPLGYQTWLPVPMWGEIIDDVPGEAGTEPDDPGGDAISADARRRTAARKSTDRSDRGDPLMLHRFETIFSIAEMINVNREVEDDDEESARRAAEDMPELTIGSNKKRPATRLKLDLDLAPRETDTAPLFAERSYPEWDWNKRRGFTGNEQYGAGQSADWR
jgi:nitric oxide reductase NorD protein